MQLLLFCLVVFLRFHATGPFQVRLSGGPNLCVGRVELFHQGKWGTVCDDDWDMRDVAVVCRDLNCGEALSAPHGAWFGEGTGPIWLNEVHCKGTERHLHSCHHLGFRKHVCTHEEDASAICSAQRFPPFTAFPPHTTVRKGKMETVTEARPVSPTPAEGTPALRLVGGSSRCSGRLEVFHQGQWGTVCDDMWDLLDVAVVCRELGCGEALAAPGGAFFGEGYNTIWLDDVQCQGEESVLAECRASSWGTHNCRHTEDAGAVCSGEMPLAMVEEHLAMLTRTLAPQRAQSAAPEIIAHPTQPTRVRAEPVAHEASWPKGKSPMEDPSEEELGGQWQVRLAGGPGSCAGRVEVLYKDRWGTVCDDGWDLVDASVVCRELGCGAPLLSTGNARYGPGSGPIWLDDVNCTGSESTLRHCRSQPWGQHNCNHHEDASIICTGRWKPLSLPKPSNDSKVAELIPTAQDLGPEDDPVLQSTLDAAETSTTPQGFPAAWEMELLNTWYPDESLQDTYTWGLELERETNPMSTRDIVETTPNPEILQHVEEREPTSPPKTVSPTNKRVQEPTYPVIQSQPHPIMQKLESEQETEATMPKDKDEAIPNPEILQHVQEMESTSPSETRSPTNTKVQEPTYSAVESLLPSAMWDLKSEREIEPTSPSGTELPTVTQSLKFVSEMVPPTHWDNMHQVLPVTQNAEPTNPLAETQPNSAMLVLELERKIKTIDPVGMELSVFSESLEPTRGMEQPTVMQNVQTIKDMEVVNLNITEESTDQKQQEESNTDSHTMGPTAAPESTFVLNASSLWDEKDVYGMADLPPKSALATDSVDRTRGDGLMSSGDSERETNYIDITSVPSLTEAPGPNIPFAEPVSHSAKLSESSSACPVRQEPKKEDQSSCCSLPALGNLVHAMEGLHGEMRSLSAAIQHQGSQLEAVARSLTELATSVNHLVGVLPTLVQPVLAQPSSVPYREEEEGQMQNQLPLK